MPSILIRRTFLRLMSAIGAASLAEAGEGAEAIESVHAPWSSGSEVARTKAPPNAADCHHHIYDSRFPVDAKAVLRPPNATVADYRLLQKRIGTTRHVVVQPSTYGVDNRCMLDAVQQFGLATTRGIGVVNESASKVELRRMDAAGVRGIRFNLQQAGATTLDMLNSLSRCVAEFGWHVEVNASPAQIVANEALWHRIPVDVVFDHLAHVPAPADSNDAFATIGNTQAKPGSSCRALTWTQKWGRPPTPMRRCCKGIHKGGTGKARLGHRLAASDDQKQAGRCATIRPPGRLGTRREHASANSRR